VRQPGYPYVDLKRACAIVAALAAATLLGCAPDKHPATPAAGMRLTVLAAGDIADCMHQRAAHSGAAQTADLVQSELAKDPAAIVLTLGDNTYPVGAPGEFSNCYEPTWGRFKNRTHPSPGNHDYGIKGAPGYYGYFGAAAGVERRGYYSLVFGNWHIISLNSNLRPPEAAAQLAWLKTELGQSNAPCTLAYWHHPVYSSGGHGNDPRMMEVWKTLLAANADLVLTAHDHNYERFAPQDAAGKRDDARGMRQFVAGTGGAHLTPLRFPRPNSEQSDNSTRGVLKLTLKDTGYEWEFLPVLPGGYTDKGAALCH
jgi:3',5'-cyclic AMP phosphodiesterase CpdA